MGERLEIWTQNVNMSLYKTWLSTINLVNSIIEAITPGEGFQTFIGAISPRYALTLLTIEILTIDGRDYRVVYLFFWRIYIQRLGEEEDTPM